MKETHWFYDPSASIATRNDGSGTLPEEEARHACNVLRLEAGDEIMVTDGDGGLWRASIIPADETGNGRSGRKKCTTVNYRIKEAVPVPYEPWQRNWIAVAPTKSTDRMEWLMEKATEVGIGTFTPLLTERSERRHFQTDRITRIATAAMKQSHKQYLPRVAQPESLQALLARTDLPKHRFIAHCYAPDELPEGIPQRRSVIDCMRTLSASDDVLILIGPEGDFSPREVEECTCTAGFIPISLGTSRLRTETAALMAVHFMGLRELL